jgi:quercetin dioxygenase-like cupin family protein
MLDRLSGALGIPMSRLFSQYDQQDRDAVLVKSGQGMEVVRRGTERGHTYHLLTHSRGHKRNVEAYLVTIRDATEAFPTFSHPGTEFIYILDGAIAYRHGNNIYELQRGDSFTFLSDVPHGPERLLKVPIRMLSIMSYHEE